jgi:hypothetical protein
MPGPLHRFEGREVTGARVRVTNAGDGLSAALNIEPAEHRHGETVYVVLEAEVSRVQYDESKDDPRQLVRVETLRAGVATLVDAELVKSVLDEQREKIEEAAGVTRLDFDGEETG